MAPSSMAEIGETVRAWAHAHRSRFSLLFLTSHLLDSSLRPDIDESIHRAAQVLERQLGWTSTDHRDGPGLTALAAVVGYLTLELRGQLRPAGTESGYSALLDVLSALGPPAAAGQIVKPPSIETTAPVMYLASSEAT